MDFKIFSFSLSCILSLTYAYVYTCTHKKSGCKGTKKNSYMQIYERKSAEFLNFVKEMGGFESKEVVDWENYRDDNAARRL